MTHAPPNLDARASTPISTRFYPLCVPKHPPHPGFDEAPYGITHEHIDMFADGTTRAETVLGLDMRHVCEAGMRPSAAAYVRSPQKNSVTHDAS